MLQQLLEHIEHYLLGYCGLQDLQVWVLSKLQIVLDSGDKAAIEVANEVDCDLVELGEGLLDEEAFRERLEGYISLKKTIVFSFSETVSPVAVHATTANETIKNRVEVLGPVEDLRLAHVFA